MAASTPDPSRTCRGAASPSVELHDHAPQRADRAPAAGRIDDARAPRAGRHDDGRRRLERPVDADAGHAAARRARRSPPRLRGWSRHVPSRGHRAPSSRTPGPPGSRCRSGSRRGRRRARARAAAGRPHRRTSVRAPGSTRRRGRRPTGAHPRPSRARGSARPLAEPERALGRVGRERLGELVGERAVARERRPVERPEDRVRGIPHGARVAPGRARRQGRPLVQGDADAAPGELGRERRADDPAADDRDVARGHGAARLSRPRPARSPGARRAAGRPRRRCCSGSARSGARPRARGPAAR